MADFAPAFEEMIRNEGGYILHNVPDDRGGDTYAGVARASTPTGRAGNLSIATTCKTRPCSTA